MRDLPLSFSSALIRGSGPWLLMLGLMGLVVGIGLSGEGGRPPWPWWWACVLPAGASTLVWSVSLLRKGRPRDVDAPDPWVTLARLSLLPLPMTAPVLGIALHRSALLPSLSDPGPFLLSVSTWVLLWGALVMLLLGPLTGTRRPYPAVGPWHRVLSPVVALVMGAAMAWALPQEHYSVEAGEVPAVPDTVRSLAWHGVVDPPVHGVHPTAHGAVIHFGDRLQGLDPRGGVPTWSYAWPGQELEAVVRSGGRIVDVLHSEREAFLSLDTGTGRRVDPPPAAVRLDLKPEGEALVASVGVRPGQVHWSHLGEADCVPTLDGDWGFTEQSARVVDSTVVLSMVCGPDMVETLSTHGLLVGLDATTGRERWRLELPDAEPRSTGTRVNGPAPIETVHDFTPAHTSTAWTGQSASAVEVDGTYVAVQSGEVLH